MRNSLIFSVLFAAAIVLLGAVIVGALDRSDRDVIGYNVLSERVFKGIVASKGNIIEGFMYVPFRTANTMMEVQIGPKEFVERSGFKLNAGEMVTVIGMPVVMKGREVVLAREVRSVNGVLMVRDRVGLPLWEKDRPIHMDPEFRVGFFDECAVIQ